MIRLLTSKKAFKPRYKSTPRCYVIGSILGRVTSNAYVWGAGFISNDDRPVGPPKKILAVRGPKGRDIFIKHGIPCPKVYGDPAILLSVLKPMPKVKKYTYGLIPHYVDKDCHWVKAQLAKYGYQVKLIDIEDKIEKVIEEVCSCNVIYSSSLHGLICADTYKIPNTRIVLSDNIFGGDFKFHDYRLGLSADPHESIKVKNRNLNLEHLEDFASLADVTNAAKNLIKVCPFDLT